MKNARANLDAPVFYVTRNFVFIGTYTQEYYVRCVKCCNMGLLCAHSIAHIDALIV